MKTKLSELSLSDLVALEHILEGCISTANKLGDKQQKLDFQSKYYSVLGEQIERLALINFNS